MKSLICINTYNSSNLVKTFIWDYIKFTNKNKNFDFILSLDGKDKNTITYCEKFNIPYIYSESNEGVGISKNRVLKEFKEYSYYFFIEDDVKLINTDVFDIHIKLSKELNIHHFSLFEENRIINKKEITKHNNYNIISAMYGSAQVNFFTKFGIETVGGFHTEFAKYKRFGHTEHTYRFMNSGLSKYPFQIIQECLKGYFKWYNPPARTRLNVETSINNLFIGEENLISQKLEYFPIKTISKYYIELKKDITIDNNYKYRQILYSIKYTSIMLLKNIKIYLYKVIK